MATPEQNKDYYVKNKEKIKEKRKTAANGQEVNFYAYALILFASLLVTITRSAAYHSGEGVPYPVLSSILLEVSFIAILLHNGWWPKILGSLIGLYLAATLIIPSFNNFQVEYSNTSELATLNSEISELKVYQKKQKKYSYEYNLARNDIKAKEMQLAAIKTLKKSESDKIQNISPSTYLNSASRIIFYLLMLFNSVFFSHKVAQSMGAAQRTKSHSKIILAWQKIKRRYLAARQAWIEIQS